MAVHESVVGDVAVSAFNYVSTYRGWSRLKLKRMIGFYILPQDEPETVVPRPHSFTEVNTEHSNLGGDRTVWQRGIIAKSLSSFLIGAGSLMVMGSAPHIRTSRGPSKEWISWI